MNIVKIIQLFQTEQFISLSNQNELQPPTATITTKKNNSNRQTKQTKQKYTFFRCFTKRPCIFEIDSLLYFKVLRMSNKSVCAVFIIYFFFISLTLDHHFIYIFLVFQCFFVQNEEMKTSCWFFSIQRKKTKNQQ